MLDDSLITKKSVEQNWILHLNQQVLNLIKAVVIT